MPLAEKASCQNSCYTFICFCSPEEKVKQLEKKVNELIEESCQANEAGNFQLVND